MAPASASPGGQGMEIARSQLQYCPGLVWVLVRSPRRAGRLETIFLPSSSGTDSRIHRSPVQLRLSHCFMGTLNLPVPSWRASFAKVCIIFITLYAFGKGINKVQDVEQEKQTWKFFYCLIPLQLPNPEVIHILGPIFPPSVKHWSNSFWHKYICHSPKIWNSLSGSESLSPSQTEKR